MSQISKTERENETRMYLKRGQTEKPVKNYKGKNSLERKKGNEKFGIIKLLQDPQLI